MLDTMQPIAEFEPSLVEYAEFTTGDVAFAPFWRGPLDCERARAKRWRDTADEGGAVDEGDEVDADERAGESDECEAEFEALAESACGDPAYNSEGDGVDGIVAELDAPPADGIVGAPPPQPRISWKRPLCQNTPHYRALDSLLRAMWYCQMVVAQSRCTPLLNDSWRHVQTLRTVGVSERRRSADASAMAGRLASSWLGSRRHPFTQTRKCIC